MKTIYSIFIFCFYLSFGYSEELTSVFNTTPKRVSKNNGFNAEDDMSVAYNSQDNLVVFSWENRAISSGVPGVTYAIYDSFKQQFTQTPTLIAQGLAAHNNVAISYNGQDNQAVFSWLANGSLIPTMVIYDFETQTFQNAKTIGKTTNKGLNDTHSCYNSSTNQFFFSWGDQTTQYPTFAVYDCSLQKFSIKAQVISQTQAHSNVFCTYNSRDNQVVFSWGVNGNMHSSYNSHENEVVLTWADSGSNNPRYAVYDCSTGSFISTNQSLGTIAVTANKYPYYAIYDPSTQTLSTTPAKISNTSTAKNLVNACYDNLNNQTVFSWASAAVVHVPVYAVYNHLTQSFSIEATNISSTLNTQDNVNNAYNSKDSQIVYSWAINTDQPVVDSTPLYYAIQALYYPSNVLLNISQQTNTVVPQK